MNSAQQDDDPLKQYNLLATFSDEQAAAAAAGTLRLHGMRDGAISLRARSDVTALDQAEMRDELEGVFASPGIIATGPMMAGAVAGSAVGAVAGAVLGLVGGALAYSGGSGLLISVIVGAVALATAGAVLGGFIVPRSRPFPGDGFAPPGTDMAGAGPERSLGRNPRDAEVVLGIHVGDELSLEGAEEILLAAHPLRLDRVSPGGDVLGTQHLGLDAPPVQTGSARQIETHEQLP